MPQEFHFLRSQNNWETLAFYRKSEVIFQLTYRFTRRFLRGNDRTVDQMVQAARSGKQNIVEGFSAGVTSVKTEVRLLNVARSSLKELQEDYEDYLKAHDLTQWTSGHPRFDAMLAFTRQHNDLPDYQPLFEKFSDEESANMGITLCRQVDRMMTKFLEAREQQFVEEGGISERMTAARLGRRQTQNEEIAALKQQLIVKDQELATLRAHIAALETKLRKWQDWYRTNHHIPQNHHTP